jgi:methionyl-tRNA formyltransferase
LENKDFIQKLKDLKPDLFVVVAYKILPKLLLSIPTIGAINLHSSLLPKYRGAAPIQRSILNHDKITGLSTFLIEPKVDTGKILLQKECKISDNDNYGSLSSKLSNIGAQLIIESIEKYSSGNLSPIIQDEKLVTLAPKIKKEEYIIDWKQNLTTIDAQIKAFSPHPGAYTMINGKRLKIFEAKMIKGINYKEVGKIINLSKTCFEVTCLSGSLKVYEVQIEGKKRMSSNDFMIGMSNLENVILG